MQDSQKNRPFSFHVFSCFSLFLFWLFSPVSPPLRNFQKVSVVSFKPGFIFCQSHQFQAFLVPGISCKRFLESTLIQRSLSFYPQYTQVAEGTFLMKYPVYGVNTTLTDVQAIFFTFSLCYRRREVAVLQILCFQKDMMFFVFVFN